MTSRYKTYIVKLAAQMGVSTNQIVNGLQQKPSIKTPALPKVKFDTQLKQRRSDLFEAQNSSGPLSKEKDKK